MTAPRGDADHIQVKSPMMLTQCYVLCSKNEFNFVCIALERQNYQDIDRAGIGLEFMAGWKFLYGYTFIYF